MIRLSWWVGHLAIEGAEALHAMHGSGVGLVGNWDLTQVGQLASWTQKEVVKDTIRAASVVEQGGLAMSLMKIAMASQKGMSISTESHVDAPGTDGNHGFLFGEEGPAVVLSVSPSHLDALHQSAGEIPVKVLGEIKSADEPFEITMNDIVLTSMTLEEMTSDFEGAIPAVVS